MSRDKDLTLLLSLWGRVPYTLRWLAYADSVRFPFKMLLADGSNDADAKTVENAVKAKGSFPHLDIDYVRYPEDKRPPDYFNKLEDAFSHIKPPFSCVGDNDDFPVPFGLAQCLDFMKKNEGYAACGGRYSGIYIDSGGVYGAPRFERRNPCWDIPAPSAGERMRAHFSRYQLTWYDVHPSALHRSLYRRLKEAAPKDLFLMELLTSFLAAAEGRVKKLPILTLIRQHGTPNTSSAQARERGDALGRMLQENWSVDFAGFVDSVSRVIAQKDGISPGQASSLVREGYRRYSGKVLAKTLAASSGPKKTTALKGLLESALGPERFERWRAKYNQSRIPLWADPQDRSALTAVRDFLAAPESARAQKA